MSPEELQQELQLQSRLLNRSTHALFLLRACNEALVRSSDEHEFLAEFCRLCVVEGGFTHASVSLENSLAAIASFGRLQAYVDSIQVTLAEQPTGAGSSAEALKTGKVQIIDWPKIPFGESVGQDQADQYHVLSSIALPLKVGDRILGLLNIYSSQGKAFQTTEQELLTQVAQLLAYGLVSRRTLANQDRLLDQTIQTIVRMVELRDPYTQGHENQVARLGYAIAHQLQLGEEEARGIYIAGLLHDVGKLRTPAEILSKPGRLDPLEFELIKLHSRAGYDILKMVQFPWPVAEIALQHHERLDGSGYPQQLQGDQILLGARIIAVADVVEAMSSHRPYRPGLGLGAAMAEITAQRGRCYDPDVVDACLALLTAPDFIWTELPRPAQVSIPLLEQD